ncbi:MAG: hypothetical protein Q8L55_05225 [Phycisphaerales bacterium]|nr:hypothetical protein [Phycisphaerales bacterium]
MARSTDPIKTRHTATRIVKTLRDAGFNALFAGGCVRDELLGLHPTDYDIATSAIPAQVRTLFRSVHEVGEAFGVMLVTIDSTTVEVATFRTDGAYTDKRRPDGVTFSDDKSDAQRRDFTVNALFLDPTGATPATHGVVSPMGGNVIDYVSGAADLASRTIRAVGDANARLNEDHLRALRAARFAARLGFTIEPATAAAIRDHASQLSGVSRERIGEEVRRMLTHPAPVARAKAAALLQGLTLDAPALGETTASTPTASIASLPAGTPFAGTLAAWLIERHRLYVPVDPRPDPRPMVTRIRASLCLTNAERDALHEVLECFSDLMAGWCTRRIAGQKRWAARAGFAHALACLQPHQPEVADKVRERLAQLGSDGIGISPTPLVDGESLIELGFRPGPVFKSLLDRLYDEQLEGRLNSKTQAVELAKVWGV